MEAVKQSVLVATGAAIGANARYWLGAWAARSGSELPWGTLLVNVSGSLVLGLFVGLASRFGWTDGWRLLIAVGLCGGYTTFSTFSLETLQLVQNGRWSLAFGYAVGSAALSVLGCALGLTIAGVGR